MPLSVYLKKIKLEGYWLAGYHVGGNRNPKSEVVGLAKNIKFERSQQKFRLFTAPAIQVTKMNKTYSITFALSGKYSAPC